MLNFGISFFFFLTPPQNELISHAITWQYKALQKVNSSNAEQGIPVEETWSSLYLFCFSVWFWHRTFSVPLQLVSVHESYTYLSSLHSLFHRKNGVWKVRRSPGGKWHNPRCCRIYVPAAVNLHVAAAFAQPSTIAAGGALPLMVHPPGRN